MENIVLKAEVFKVIRANSDKTKHQIMRILKEEFKNDNWNDVVRVLEELSK